MASRRQVVGMMAFPILLLVLGFILVASARVPMTHATPLAYTSCTLSGPGLVMNAALIPPEDTLPVRVHEEEHVRQCSELGWAAMRWRNLTATGRLSLEAPGYCAGARARLRRGDNYQATRERLFDDANAMFAGSVDSATVNGALRAACPEVTASLMQ